MDTIGAFTRSIWRNTKDAIAGILSAGREPDSQRARRTILQVEEMEGRIALSRAAVGAHPAPALVGHPTPERRTLTVNIPVELPEGFGWFLEVRKAGSAKSKWTWKGPFADVDRARAKLRHQGMVVRGQQLVLPDDPSQQQPMDASPPMVDLGSYDPGPIQDPGPTQPQYLQGFEIQGLDPIFGWRSMSPRLIYTNTFAASQEVQYRDQVYYPIVYRYVSVSLPASQWHIVGNVIVSNF
jgi:hypothetical protein